MSEAFVRRIVWVPSRAGTRPIEVTHPFTMREYCRVDRWDEHVTAAECESPRFPEVLEGASVQKACPCSMELVLGGVRVMGTYQLPPRLKEAQFSTTITFGFQ
jgi:hypothetical protein